MGIFLLKEFDTNFLGNDLSADIIFLGKTKSHLLKDKFHLVTQRLEQEL